MTDVIDLKLALEQAGDNEELAKELFEMLLKEIPEHKQKLNIAIKENDLQGCWDHAHKIYGSTAYCGVPALRKAAQRMESAVKNEDMAEIEEKFADLSKEMDRLLDQGPRTLTTSWET